MTEQCGWKEIKQIYWIKERLIRPYIWKLDFIKWYVKPLFNFILHTRFIFSKVFLCLVVLLVYSVPSDMIFRCQPFDTNSLSQFSLCSSILYCTDWISQFFHHIFSVGFSLLRSLIVLKYLIFMPSSLTHVSCLRIARFIEKLSMRILFTILTELQSLFWTLRAFSEVACILFQLSLFLFKHA